MLKALFDYFFKSEFARILLKISIAILFFKIFFPMELGSKTIFILIPDEYCFFALTSEVKNEDAGCGYFRSGLSILGKEGNFIGVYRIKITQLGPFDVSNLPVKHKLYYYQGQYLKLALFIFVILVCMTYWTRYIVSRLKKE